MRQRAWLAAALAFVPAYLSAGPIYGVILLNSAALRGASIRVECPGARGPATGSTLDDGSYRVQLAQKGRCIFTVATSSFQAKTDVVSLEDSVQYNFVVVAANGRYELRRR